VTLPFLVSVDAEAEVIAALNAGLPTFGESVWAGSRIPSPVPGVPMPTEFYRVLLAGGPRETLVTDAFRILLEAWAVSEQRAARLLNIGRAILLAQNGTLFGVVEYAGPANLPDPTTDRVRYTASLTVRARAALTA
jgi:hypothetical protein